ncbi:HPr-rel-A system PqqD family peptide chaperone [Massilia sp. UBA6681]|jgi:PqqD family protein of HPr-rel-A system|uniref:HPr-rel-A system PqqD family peptide chaperone n=1 Tax=Massilia sp. UBA6681 TaxID=1946839 RepID=UPI0025BED9F5|nr:HPr-rel-A system PqqD family peptide chaperone [Massilia sp. UBA6681]
MLPVELSHAVWRLIAGQSLRYRCWDEEAVLYNDLSGATHLLGPAALCVLEALRPGPASMAALASRLLDEFEIDDASVGAELHILLDEMSQLSLIESCPC